MNISDPIQHDPSKYDFNTWVELETRRRIKRLRKMYALEDLEIKEKLLAADYQLCKKDPLYWIENYVWIANPKGDEKLREIPYVLYPRQKELLSRIHDSVINRHPLLVNKGRELGVTWEFICYVAHAWRFSNGFSAKLGSRKESLVDDSTVDSLFGKLRFLFKRMPAHLREKNVKDILLQLINNRNGSEIIGEATNPGFGRGGRKTGILFDEFAHVPPAIAAACWTSVDTVSETIWLPSTPNGKANKFYQLYSEFPEEYVFEMNWRADPYRDETWKAKRLEKQSVEEFEQEHEASFSAIRTGKIYSFNRDSIVYTETDPEWSRNSTAARANWFHMGGWDFGSGPSLSCCLLALLEWDGKNPIPTIWLDDELVWKGTSFQTVANDTLQRLTQYGSSKKFHVADPASKNRESDQSSWLSNLQGCGIPLQALPGEFNTRDGIDDSIRLVQWMLDSRKLRIHERCKHTLEALQSWRYDIPDGVPPELMNKTWIAPRKDVYSHTMNALMYLVRAAYMYMQRHPREKRREGNSENSKLPSAQLSAAMRRARSV
jgi:hypothetical protein